MHIQRLKLRDFRNLQDVEVFFFERDQSNGSCAFNTHAIIGQNGSGKSNLIEAIITIFRSLRAA